MLNIFVFFRHLLQKFETLPTSRASCYVVEDFAVLMAVVRYFGCASSNIISGMCIMFGCFKKILEENCWRTELQKATSICGYYSRGRFAKWAVIEAGFMSTHYLMYPKH